MERRGKWKKPIRKSSNQETGWTWKQGRGFHLFFLVSGAWVGFLHAWNIHFECPKQQTYPSFSTLKLTKRESVRPHSWRCPRCCHDSRGSIPSPVRHKLLNFYASASEFRTGPTLKAGWSSNLRSGAFPTTADSEMEPKVMTDECESPIIRIRRMMHVRNIKTSIWQSLWSRMKALEFVAWRRKNKRRGDWVLNVRDGNRTVMMMKQQRLSLFAEIWPPGEKKTSRLPHFNLSFFIPMMSFLSIQTDSSKNVSTWMMLPDYRETGPSQWNSALGLQFHFLQPEARGARQN